MTTTIDLSPEEQTLLAVHLDRHLHHLDAELVRTEKHDLRMRWRARSTSCERSSAGWRRGRAVVATGSPSA